MFANAEANVATRAVRFVEILVRRDVVIGRAVEIRAAADQQGQFGREGLQHVASRRACREFGVGREQRDFFQQSGRTWRRIRTVKQRRFFRIGGPPRLKGFGPPAMRADQPLFVRGKISAHVVAHVEMAIGRQAEPDTRGVGKLRAAFTVTFGRAFDLGNPFGNQRPCNDELRAAGLGSLRLVEGLQQRLHLIAGGNRLHIPTDRLEPLARVLALCLVRHRIECDVVGVINQNQVVQPLMTGEFDRLHGQRLPACSHRPRDRRCADRKSHAPAC